MRAPTADEATTQVSMRCRSGDCRFGVQNPSAAVFAQTRAAEDLGRRGWWCEDETALAGFRCGESPSRVPPVDSVGICAPPGSETRLPEPDGCGAGLSGGLTGPFLMVAMAQFSERFGQASETAISAAWARRTAVGLACSLSAI